MKDPTDTDRSDSYFDIHLDTGSDGRLRKKPYYKSNDFNFPIVNFPFSSNFPATLDHLKHISLSLYNIAELVVPIMISLIEGCCKQGSYRTKGS